MCFLHYKAPGGRTQVSRGAYILLAFFPVFAILLLVRTAAKEDLPMAQWLVLPSPVGELTLAEENGALTGLYFGTRCLLGEKGTSPLLEEAVRQLQEYFAGCRREFFLPLAPRGTEFQRQVWHALEGPGHRQAQSLPGSGHGQPPEPPVYPGALPPGGGRGRLPHRLRRRPGSQAVPAGAGKTPRKGRGKQAPAFSKGSGHALGSFLQGFCLSPVFKTALAKGLRMW